MLSISKNKCVGCGICEVECPTKAISVDINRGIAVFNQDECVKCGICLEKCPQGAIKDIKGEITIAIGTDDQETIKSDDHFGMSKYFQIWKYSNGNLILKETIENAKYQEDETKVHGDPGKAKATASVLEGIDVLVSKIMGPNIVRLKNKFIPTVIRVADIKEAIEIIKENINEIFEEKEKTDRRGIILQ